MPPAAAAILRATPYAFRRRHAIYDFRRRRHFARHYAITAITLIRRRSLFRCRLMPRLPRHIIDYLIRRHAATADADYAVFAG